MKAGLVITQFNRSSYTRRCLESLKAIDVKCHLTIVFIDDCSNEPEAIKLFQEFYMPDVAIIKIRNAQNMGVCFSLMQGFNRLIIEGCNLLMNLDNDAIVKKDFLNLVYLYESLGNRNILTGFNSLTKNRNGSERHIVLDKREGWCQKKSVGGINMVFNIPVYNQFVRTALERGMQRLVNWDNEACNLVNAGGGKVIATTPSLVQHIGFKSSMGHSFGGELPDTAADFKIELPNVTLIGVSGNDIDALRKAADISTKGITFGAVKMLTHVDYDDPRIVKIRPITSKAEYNKFVLKELVDYVDTPYFIIFQSDGYLLNASAWDDEFFKYDYIGAVWNWYRDGYTVGNGGFSWRSKRLHNLLKSDDSIVPTNDYLIKNYEEDHNIARLYRGYLERVYSIKFAPEHIANKFSIEAYGVRPPGNKYNDSLGFHGWSVDFSGAALEHKPKK